MSFLIDKQGHKDLSLFSSNEKGHSLINFYDNTKTIGGQLYLHRLMQTPMSDIAFLENRKSEINFFYKLDGCLELSKRQLDYVEFYLAMRQMPLRNNMVDSLKDYYSNRFGGDGSYYTIKEGIFHLSSLLNNLRDYLSSITISVAPESIRKRFARALKFVSSEPLNGLLNNPPRDYKELKSRRTNQFDNFFRQSGMKDLRYVLDLIYKIDVLQTLSDFLIDKYFCLPEYVEGRSPVLEVEEFVHPLIEDPVANSIKHSGLGSLYLITGPNMSGKSTFLKSIGVLTYCAHLGIPVPAKHMKTSIFDGMFTTINLPDNMNQGLSHFLAEVRRIKDMVSLLEKRNRIIVILDELFRGTNVKDAYDGTIMIIELLSKIEGPIFFISTHILEAAEKLLHANNIQFLCFESKIISNEPVYDYKLRTGVSDERVGVQIVLKEGIRDILTSIINKQESENIAVKY